MAADGVEIAIIGVAVGGDFRPEFFTQAFSGKRDGGQRIFNFMGDALRHIGPCGAALGGHKGGDVIEGNNIAFDCITKTFGRNLHMQHDALFAAHDRYVGAGNTFGFFLSNVQQVSNLRQNISDGFLHHGSCMAQQLAGGAVMQGDVLLCVDGDNASGNARQHRFGEAAAFIDEAVGVHKVAALRFKLTGHAVKGAAQISNFIIGAAFWHFDGVIAAAHPFGGAHQRTQRFNQPHGK